MIVPSVTPRNNEVIVRLPKSFLKHRWWVGLRLRVSVDPGVVRRIRVVLVPQLPKVVQRSYKRSGEVISKYYINLLFLKGSVLSRLANLLDRY